MTAHLIQPQTERSLLTSTYIQIMCVYMCSIVCVHANYVFVHVCIRFSISLRRDIGRIFSDPVTDDIAPGYSALISQPMDISTMGQKIALGQYATVKDFRVSAMTNPLCPSQCVLCSCVNLQCYQYMWCVYVQCNLLSKYPISTYSWLVSTPDSVPSSCTSCRIRLFYTANTHHSTSGQ